MPIRVTPPVLLPGPAGTKPTTALPNGATHVALLQNVDGEQVVYASVGERVAGDSEQRVDAGPEGTLVVTGPRLFAQDRRVLGAFADAAGTALEGRRLAEQAAAAEAVDRLRTVMPALRT